MGIKEHVSSIFFRRITGLLIVGFLSLLPLTSCSSTPISAISDSAATLTIRNVEPQGQMGVYLVSGDATSLNGAMVTVSAVRNLSDGESGQAPIYGLLDRQFGEVSDGQWQAKLHLWQLEGASSPQEAWQRDQTMFDMALTPDSEVRFMVTLDPVEAREWPQAIAQEGADTPAMIQYTPDGERYVMVQETTAIPIPTRQAIDSGDSSAARRIRDGNVATVAPEAATAADSELSGATSRTTMPLTPSHYLQ